MKHGRGKLIILEEGTNFEGMFSENFITGHGEFTYSQKSSKRRYIGQWLKNKKHGIGTLEWKSGKIYKGTFYMDRFHGDGIICHSNGIIEAGIWHHGKLREIQDQSI